NGTDLFPWWEEGLTPRFYLGRATVEMCMNVRWREHISDEEGDRLERGDGGPYGGFQGDPAFAVPGREGGQIIDYLDMEGEVEAEIRRRAAAEPQRPLLGYRRHPVRVSLCDGWSITVSGAMAEEWKEGSWSAWDGDRTVWFSCWSVRRDDGPV